MNELMLREWNTTQTLYPKNQSLANLIEKTVEHFSKKTALFFNNQSIQYSTLNKRSNQLAHLINTSISGTGHFVAIYLDRSIESIISFLAILKSNNVYVPIDIDAPTKMVKQIIEECQISAIITGEKLPPEIDEAVTRVNAKVIDLKKTELVLQSMPEQNPVFDAPTSLAYVLFTSGTTGKPKGVQVTQQGLINLLFAMKKEVDFTEDEVLLAITPFTFDISGVEIYLPLLFGASLVLADKTMRFDPHTLIKAMTHHRITTMQATPATWQILINAGWENKQQIKMICGGESLNTWLATKLFNTRASLWNFYGPTETTIWSTCHKVKKIDLTHSSIPIGKPLANTQVYILDEQLKVQPIGGIGELYIGGDGVAHGYLNNEELNRKCFIPDPFSTEPNNKLYKTGDLAFWSAQGELHCLGRIDTQMKIRGYRIEAEAIENALMNFDGIKECVVLDKNPAGLQELTAYFILHDDLISISKLQLYLKENFPDYMIPSAFFSLDKFPLTSSGKVDRKLIPTIPNIKPLNDNPIEPTRSQNVVEEILVSQIREILKRTDINPDANFMQLGLHSLFIAQLANSLSKAFLKPISAIDLFTYPSVKKLAAFIQNKTNNQSGFNNLQPLSTVFNEGIAVIGMACKFPGANNPTEFWQRVSNKEETIQFFNKEELKKAGVDGHILNNPDYVPARGILSEIDQFDAAFFGYTPSEASLMDPQHRVFLEQAWSALENAGYSAEKFPGKIGVFAGMNDSSYLTQNLLKNSTVRADYDTQQLMLATSTHYLCTKVAYAMGLKGPAVTINTACSTSLVAIAMACDSLSNFNCDMALAGGITINLPQQSGYFYQELGILSPDGHCRVFDKDSKGTVMSNGCGVVVLKRLPDALRDKDNIIAVIKGWATNNDGENKAGFTAPSVTGQVECIQKAMEKAQINSSEIEYIEAHGTGTLLGDPIEVTALTKGYSFEKKQSCVLGSVKANIGHTDVAAGVAGFIKLALALQNKTLPPNINYHTANPKINFEESPFYVNSVSKPWETKTKRIGAVNSLGFGGTNAHLILEEAPELITTSSKSANVLLLSAKNQSSLTRMADELQEYLSTLAEVDKRESVLADIAYTLQMGRGHFDWRLAIPYKTFDDVLCFLANKALVQSSMIKASKQTPQIIFGFAGQGTQYIKMAFDLYQEEPFFKQLIDNCCENLKEELHIDLRAIIFSSSENKEEANRLLFNTKYAQPALFVIEYALAQWLIELGLKPTAMIGHSLGEYVAATIAGVLKFEDALKLIAARAQLMSQTKPGAMLVVPLSQEKVLSLLKDYPRLDLAAHNAPRLCVVAGPKEEIKAFELAIAPLLASEDLTCSLLHTSHAFHSAAMDEVLEDFTRLCALYPLNSPNIPYLSNLSGHWMATKEKDAAYFTKHLRSTVLFSEAVKTLNLQEDDLFIEVGPGQTLIQLVRQNLQNPQSLKGIATLPSAKEQNENSYFYFLTTLGKLWRLGHDIHWERLYTDQIRKRVPLPTYSFERQSHWISPDQTSPADEITNRDSQGLYTPNWKREGKYEDLTKVAFTKNESQKTWFIFSDTEENEQLAQEIKANSPFVYRIYSGQTFSKLDNFSFTLNPSKKEDYEQLLKSIDIPTEHCVVIHTWLLSDLNHSDTQSILSKGAYSLLYLTQLFAENHSNKTLQILVLTSALYRILGTESLDAIKASVLGACKVIPLEQNNITCKLIDLEEQPTMNSSLSKAIYQEALSTSLEDAPQEIAYRGVYRWKRELEPCSKQLEAQKKVRLKKEGVYLITGGLGGIGLSLAQYLAENYHANLILIGRTAFVSEDEWQGSEKKRNALFSIKKNAKSLRIEQASVENRDEMHRVIQLICEQFGRIHGVIHAAGVAGGGATLLKTTEEYNKVLLPKLQGTQNLIELLKDEPLDFVVLMSSITSIAGFPGQIDYCSANRILDSYASVQVFHPKTFCIAMNWQAWRDVGMAVDSETKLFNFTEKNSHSPAEGCLLFEKMVNGNLNQVVISHTNPNQLTTDDVQSIKENESAVSNPLPHHDVTNTLLALWRNVLGIADVSLDDDFYELGGHSLLAISLLTKIRNLFNIKIPSSILLQERTVRALAKVIESYVQEQENSPLVLLNQGGKEPPLFIVHPVGGTVFCYLPLANQLSDRTIYGLQDPSIELEKPLFQTIEEMATCYRRAIQSIQPQGPYYLCGASFGATVVIEIAHQLLAQNQSIHFVGLFDGWAALSGLQLKSDYAKTLILHHEGFDEAALVPKDVSNPALWENLLKHRLEMMVKYKIKKVHTKLSLFKAEDILSEYQEINAPDNHWSDYATLLDVYPVPGDHNTMLQNPNVTSLASFIRNCLIDR